MYPCRIDFDYSISVFAVAHVEGTSHHTRKIAAAVVSAGFVAAPGMVMSVDMTDDRILFEQFKIVGTVVKIVEEGIVIE